MFKILKMEGNFMFVSKVLKLCHIISKDEYKLRKEIEIVKHSAFFDEKWYLEKYPDVKKSGKDPVTYYCTRGWRQGHNPGPYFNASLYISENPDIGTSNQNPLVHYEKHGKWENRKGSPIVRPQAQTPLKKRKECKDYFFSIIVASYNYQDFIKETLNSLAEQSYKNFEVIVVDDGSEDDSLRIIKEYVQKYPFIKLYQHKNGMNRGLPETVLLGVQKAKGEYIAFCESDDFWTSNHLKELNLKINETSDAQIIVNDVLLIGDETRCKIMERIVSDRKRTILNQRGLLSDDQFRTSNYIVSFSCCCVKRMLLTTCDFLGVPNKVELDWWLWRQICCSSPICYIDKKLTFYRMHQSYAVKASDDVKKRQKSDELHEISVEKLDLIMEKRKYNSVFLNNGKLSDIDKFQIMEFKAKRKNLIKKIKSGDWKDIKVCYISTTNQGTRPIADGSVRYRCHHPAEVLSSKGAFVTIVPHSVFLKSLSYYYDIYIFHRPCKAEIPTINNLRNLGKILIADYDDLIFGNQQVAIQSSLYKNLKLPLEQISEIFQKNMDALLRFDIVSVSTERLKKEVQTVFPSANVFVVHNFIPDSILTLSDKLQVREMPKDRDLLMYCTGTLSHNMDFVQVEEILLSCLAKDPDLKLLIFGVLNAPEKFKKISRVFFHNIVDYWNLFEVMSPAAFTVAPLEMPSLFNECKSNVKFLESSVAGATLFATPIGDMKRVQKAGIKLCATPDDWEKAILNRCQIDVQKNIKQNIDYVKHNCSTETFIKEFTNIFSNMEV